METTLAKQHDEADEADEAQRRPGRPDERKSLVGDGSASYGSMRAEAEAEEVPVQAGVRTIEAISRSWTKWGLIVAYIS
jgi:hypothetical protein